MLATSIKLSGILNSATSGAALAAQVCEHLAHEQSVEVDAREVTRVTPSFANAFVMATLAAFPDTFIASRCTIVANDFVRSAFMQSQDRYARGIRLSTQR